MRLLVTSAFLPWPADNGYKMRTLSVLRGLASLGHEVTLLAFASPEEAARDRRPLEQWCRRVEVVPMALASLTTAGSYLARMGGLLSGLPFSTRRFRSAEMERRIRDWLRSASGDAVIADGLFSLINVPPTRVPVLLNAHNVEHVILERYARRQRSPLKSLYARLEARKLRAFERAACRRAVVVMACSEVDRRHLARLGPGAPAVVVPNVVDLDRYAAVPASDEHIVLFQGGLDWYPNRDAVAFFVSEILPHVQRGWPAARFVVAGRNPSEAFRRRWTRPGGIEFTGTVDDMRPVIARATLCVVPLRIGSGTRLKILEAAAMERPVVSTWLGAEGLGFVEGEEIVLVDDPRAFAEAVIRLLAEPECRMALGRAARRRVEQDYSMRVLRRSLGRALEGVAVAARARDNRPAIRLEAVAP
jgi:glycosyltransferase involved in cell wall biosynthesis